MAEVQLEVEESSIADTSDLEILLIDKEPLTPQPFEWDSSRHSPENQPNHTEACERGRKVLMGGVDTSKARCASDLVGVWHAC